MPKYLQGKTYLSDFNIVEVAGGAGKGFSKDFDVNVTHNTLEIHLYWAGKGTTAIPARGVYGPLISAIAVTPSESNILVIDLHSFLFKQSSLRFFILVSIIWKHFHIIVDFEIPSEGLSTGAIAGIVVGSCVFLIISIVFILRKMGFVGGKDSKDKRKIKN